MWQVVPAAQGRSLLGERCSDVSAAIDWLQAEAGASPALAESLVRQYE